MIPSGVEIFVALEPIDMRFSFDRLSGLAKEQIGYEARSGALFVFFSRRRDALKSLFFDGSGMCQFYKRLDRRAIAIVRHLILVSERAGLVPRSESRTDHEMHRRVGPTAQGADATTGARA
jgi:transposase